MFDGNSDGQLSWEEIYQYNIEDGYALLKPIIPDYLNEIDGYYFNQESESFGREEL